MLRLMRLSKRLKHKRNNFIHHGEKSGFPIFLPKQLNIKLLRAETGVIVAEIESA